jgi:hypothetical protein
MCFKLAENPEAPVEALGANCSTAIMCALGSDLMEVLWCEALYLESVAGSAHGRAAHSWRLNRTAVNYNPLLSIFRIPSASQGQQLKVTSTYMYR